MGADDMQKGKRQDFSDGVKREVARRVALRCSRPGCGKLTSGPGKGEGAIYKGEVAHITAASPGGPRYDPAMSKEERTSYSNAIFLCKECAAIIDQDVDYYTVEMLRQWKKEAEERTRWEIEEGGTKNRYGYTAKELLPYRDSFALTQIKYIFDNNYEFFPESELMQMEKMVCQLEQEDFPYALLEGMPASGKSVFLYKIAKRFEKKDYKVYYYTCKEGFILYDLIQDLNFYENTNPIGKKLYIIDDIHLSQERVSGFFERVLSEKLGGAILFVSRDIKGEDSNDVEVSIYKRLEDVDFKLEFSPESKNVKKKKSQQLTISGSINKIKGIIQTFSKSVTGDNELGNDEIVQVADKVGYDLLNLWYYLQTWEEENTKNPGIGLNMIEKRDVLKHVYDAMLKDISPFVRMAVIKYACLYQYEVGFELHINDYDIYKELKEECTIRKENQLYSFYHSKYAEMLVEAFEAYDEFFDVQYKDLCDMVIVNVGHYIKSYYHNRGRKYPKNLFELFEGILTDRNSNIP